MQEIVDDLRVSSNYFLKNINHRILSELVRDERKLSIHDKIIVITAEQEGVGILSKDEDIKQRADTEVIW